MLIVRYYWRRLGEVAGIRIPAETVEVSPSTPLPCELRHRSWQGESGGIAER
jgi:hypothetical protein